MDEPLDANALAAYDLLPEAVVLVGPAGAVVHANRRAGALLDLGPEAVDAPLARALELFDDAGNPCADLLASLRRGPARVAEQILRVRLKDGRLRPVSLAGTILADGSTLLTFRHAGRREQVDATRSDLVATVSHEIRSPLTSVKGFTRTLLARWERFSDEQKRTMLETINADADRVTRLLTELLDVSRIDAGRVQLRRQPIDLAIAIHHVVEKAQHRPEGVDRDLEISLPGRLPLVLADPDKVEQILTNLVENALKYAPDSPVRIEAERSDGVVEVRVSDHGPGIPEDQVRRVFEKFGRGRDNRRSGTGLGLYITRGLARAHGGDVWCRSREGAGATFHVTLPVADGMGPEKGRGPTG